MTKYSSQSINHRAPSETCQTDIKLTSGQPIGKPGHFGHVSASSLGLEAPTNPFVRIRGAPSRLGKLPRCYPESLLVEPSLRRQSSWQALGGTSLAEFRRFAPGGATQTWFPAAGQVGPCACIRGPAQRRFLVLQSSTELQTACAGEQHRAVPPDTRVLS